VLPEPGKRLTGLAAIREFTAATLDMPIEFGARQIVEGAGIALHVRAWRLQKNSGGPLLEGSTADVLSKQPNGDWLIAIDNPWGTGILI
jgi:ketosteroid isomerase-like protein